jgi:hypothetical protein
MRRHTFADCSQSANIHPFWHNYVDRFLQPSQHTLSKLVLYSDVPVGWFPKLDLRPIHLGRLRSLTLGQRIFHKDHQFDWILSHGSTLEELNLDRCSILYQIGHCIEDWRDDDGYPIGKDTDSGGLEYGWSIDPGFRDGNDFYFSNRGRRWHKVFPDFAVNLPKLRTFRFGSSKQWNLDVESRYAGQSAIGTFSLPIMPWRDEENIVSSILDDRYTIWDNYQQEYRARWRIEQNAETESFRGFNGMGEEWPDELVETLQPFPDCETKDRDALEMLLEVTRSGDRDVYFCKDDCSCDGTHD